MQKKVFIWYGVVFLLFFSLFGMVNRQGHQNWLGNMSDVGKALSAQRKDTEHLLCLICEPGRRR